MVYLGTTSKLQTDFPLCGTCKITFVVTLKALQFLVLILQDQDALRESVKTDVAVLHSKEQVGSIMLHLTCYIICSIVL